MNRDLDRLRRGTHPVSREALAQIPVTPRGTRSDRWSGIQHGELATQLVRRVEAAGLTVTAERWSVGRSGAHLFGYLDLDPDQAALDVERARAMDESGTLEQWQVGFGGFNPQLIRLRMGIAHSNDSSLSLQLVVIPVVLVCLNGMSVEGGTVAIQKKHTSGLDLVPVLDEGIQTFVRRSQKIDETITRLKAVDLCRPERADHLIVEAGRRFMFPWSQLGRVVYYWRQPPHPEFEERNGWSLMNAFSEVAKRFTMKKEMAAANNIRQLILSSNGRG